jgi:hypothetical protein
MRIGNDHAVARKNQEETEIVILRGSEGKQDRMYQKSAITYCIIVSPVQGFPFDQTSYQGLNDTLSTTCSGL